MAAFLVVADCSDSCVDCDAARPDGNQAGFTATVGDSADSVGWLQEAISVGGGVLPPTGTADLERPPIGRSCAFPKAAKLVKQAR
jgi:hypothetical protein